MLALMLPLVTAAHSRECTGDLQVVLVDPVATERARDAVADALLRGAERLGEVGKVIAFTLTTGMNNDGWTHAMSDLQEWMTLNGVEGTVSLGSLAARERWYRLSPTEQVWVEETVIQPGLPGFHGFFPDNTAIFVHLADPRQAAVAATGRGLGWFPSLPRLKAQALIVQAMVPTLVEKRLDAFVSLGEGVCK